MTQPPPADRDRTVDLLLLVERKPGDAGLVFRPKASPPVLGLDFERYETEPLERGSASPFEEFFGHIEKLEPRDVERQLAAVNRLTGLGVSLFEQLLPLELRRKLWRHWEAITTVRIVSNEVWIPWELLKLSDPDGPTIGPFLVEAFSLTRWIEGCRERLELPLRKTALVVPTTSRLDHTLTEREVVVGLLEKAGIEVEDVPARELDLSNALASGTFGGFHFAGHGFVRGKNPDLWSIQLELGHQLQPTDLKGKARRLGEAYPLIFLNTCHSGRGAPSLTGLGGLASAFLEVGAGAFIGAHWSLPDARALVFAELFYRHFLAGLPLGEAIRQARITFRDSYPGDPTWLAYTVFGHPLARCQSQDERDISSPPFQDDEHVTTPRLLHLSKDKIGCGVRPEVWWRWWRSLRGSGRFVAAGAATILLLLTVVAWLGLSQIRTHRLARFDEYLRSLGYTPNPSLTSDYRPGAVIQITELGADGDEQSLSPPLLVVGADQCFPDRRPRDEELAMPSFDGYPPFENLRRLSFAKSEVSRQLAEPCVTVLVQQLEDGNRIEWFRLVTEAATSRGRVVGYRTRMLVPLETLDPERGELK